MEDERDDEPRPRPAHLLVVPHRELPRDTDPEIYKMQIEHWKRVGIEGRVAALDAMCEDVERLARAGIAADHPNFSELEICRELVRRRYGEELARAAYEGLLPSL